MTAPETTYTCECGCDLSDHCQDDECCNFPTYEVEELVIGGGYCSECRMCSQFSPRADLPFEREFKEGLLPSFHITRDGKTIPFHELTRDHLFLAWRWFFEHDRDSYVYKALQREKSRRARNLPVAEVKPAFPLPDPPTEVVICTCGAPMKLRKSRFGLFWGCTKFPECTVTHGAHPDGKPLGRPGTKEEKLARIEAHAVFDQLWQKSAFAKRKPRMKRTEAYVWLQKAMGLSKEAAHIGMFNVEQCKQLIELVNKFLEAA